MEKIRLSIIIISILSCFVMKAQVGIGTTTPKAQLDIPASNVSTPTSTDGILIPRISAFPAVNPTVAQNSMLVFLNNASGLKQPGFYYWNNASASWIAVGSTLTNNWNLLGNTGTNSSTNFLGTTDNQDIVFKRNNLQAGYIGNPTFLTGNMNTVFGSNSFLNLTGIRNTAIGSSVLTSNTTGSQNTSVGERSMYLNTEGSENTAIGVGSLYSNTKGNGNTALGRNALTANTEGNFNTGTGVGALRDTKLGSSNTANGYSALLRNTAGGFNSVFGVNSMRTNLSGNNNSALGYQSLYSNSAGNNNVALGYNAGFFELGSNKLYIANSDADAVNALLYGEFDNKIVRANGELQIGNPATTGYKLPTARGTDKQVLQTDGTGNVSWANANNSLSVMRCNISSNQNLIINGWQKINFDTILFDSNSEFTAINGRFTAKNTGYYRVNSAYHIFGLTNDNYYSIAIYLNGSIYQESSENHRLGPVFRNINGITFLNAGDFIEIYAQCYVPASTIDQYSGKTFFEVSQIK